MLPPTDRAPVGAGLPDIATAVQVGRVKAMARTPPRDKGLPLSRWSCPKLAQQTITDGICGSISPATIRRWLSEDALKPWQYQSWIFITDPDFAVNAQRILDLYDRTWDGKPFPKERRPEPQITLGLLTDLAGFPLTVEAFEGNKAEWATMPPVINAFKTAHQMSDVTVVADAGMISEANQVALQAAGVVFHLGRPYPASSRRGARVARQTPR